MSSVIAINAGSSSVKVTLYELSDSSESVSEVDNFVLNEEEASGQDNLSSRLRQIADKHGVVAIGHRLVSGGPKYLHPVKVSKDLLDDLRSLEPYDPDHLPLSLKLIDLCAQTFEGVDQYACFDSTFFLDMPKEAQILPLPQKYQEEGLRRYGFHGLSYTYLQNAFRDVAGEAAVNGRVIYAHLGSGASLAATYLTKPIDTTMSFTPASGLVMSSRSGDLDPGIGWYLFKRYDVSPEQFNHMVNAESGLLGVSGLSADMKTLLEHEMSNQGAAEAVSLFCYRTAQAIGALSTTIGGLDSLIFSGGIGEQSAILRQRICDRLAFLGVKLDDSRNQTHEERISADESSVGVHMLHTDEAYSIASQVALMLNDREADHE
ncbi:MAG: acetate/propionate family kinase [Candidatus Saccharimonadales bacterium]